MKKRICIIAQFPPPIHGLSKAVETLYDSKLAEAFDFEKVDITNNKRFLFNLVRIWRSKADLFYFTISQTWGGNIRDLMIFRLLALQKKKCLVHLHGGYYRRLVDNDLRTWQKRANYRFMKQIAGAIVLGPSLKRIFQGMLPDRKIYTVPNCVDDTYLMSDVEFDEKLATLPSRKVKHVLYLSNFIRSKGYPEVMEMAKLEKARVEAGVERQFHFDFAGKFFEKVEEDFFRDYVRENRLDDYVTLHGVVAGNDKRALLAKCDVFALLTRYPKEGQPISILEAMGNGMVVLTTDFAGIPDIVTDGEDGLVFPTSQEIDVADVLSRLEKVDMARLMVNGRARVKAGYQQKNYIEALSRVFREV